ncbi:MAG: hypothetical protein PVJ21_10175 [Anaerolineales bacterium]
MVFSNAMEKAQKGNALKLLAFFGREIRDWPGAVFREYLRARKGIRMNQNHLTWRPLNTSEFLAGLALFILPIFPSIVRLLLGYNTLSGKIVLTFTYIILITGLVIFVIGIRSGFPRWTLPFLGVGVISLVMLQAVYPIWGLFADKVRMMLNYSTRTLTARIQYSVLLGSFFWQVSFVFLTLLVLLMMAWPRTRLLAQRIRKDWTLMSFMIYSALVFDLELIFDEYAYDEAWKIASRICLIVGAWIYFRAVDQRKRIWTLIVGATLFFGIAAVGQWVVLPLQSWGDFYGYDHWTYRRVMLSGTLTSWVNALFFMLIPALINLIPQHRKADYISEETFTTA